MRFLSLFALAVTPAFAQQPFLPDIEPASDDAARALATFEPGTGLAVELVAAEPDLANPVALDVDARGRIWVVETHRLRRGVFDMREHTEWIDRDLACRSVDDRLALLRDWFGEEVGTLEVASERIRRLEVDSSGGVRATVFADGFDDLGHGVAAGILVDGDDVWFTCLPELWRLRDTDDDGRCDERTAVHSGFGVRFQFIGHDMHGLRIGPDRRIYFSIGDRGLHVSDEVSVPETGAILRCELDGSKLEVVARGYRNPQELAFDAAGNLFTGDNNGDGGDHARWVYVVEGADAGWRCGYQWLPDRGPWNRDGLWKPAHAGQPSWIVPPVMNLVHGPAGLTYFPIDQRPSGLPARFTNHFFLCDYRASPRVSGIWAFEFVPRGAGFEIARREKLLWGVCATDVEVGPDGSAYLTDWVSGWGLSRRGRVYRVHHAQDGIELAAPDVENASVEALDALLDSPDMRVRQRAQFRLVDLDAVDVLARIAHDPDRRFGQRHAIWGLGILARANGAVAERLRDLLRSGDAEVLAQTARVLGEAEDRESADAIAELTRHPSDRTRFFACQALAQLGDQRHVAAILDVLRDGDDHDPFLRHAAVSALHGIGHLPSLRAAIAAPNVAVRRGVLLALARLRSTAVASALADPEPTLVGEAARAIYREPIPDALPALAALVHRPGVCDVETWRRALAANRRLGTNTAAAALAAFACREDVAASLRVESLEFLGEWAEPAPRDPIHGGWRPLAPRDEPGHGAMLLGEIVPALLGDTEAVVARTAARLAGTLALSTTTARLAEIAEDRGRDGSVRAACIEALGRLGAEALDALLDELTPEDPVSVRQAGVRWLAERSPAKAVPVLKSLCENAARGERQNAMAVLGAMEQESATRIVVDWLDRLRAGAAPADLALDIVEAAEARAERDPPVAEALRRYRESLDPTDALAPFRIALEGGDRDRGSKVFFEHPVGQCLRCHAIDYHGGKAGPRLDALGTRTTREHLLESLVEPNAQIADGFATEVVTLDDGSIRAGVLAGETATSIELVDMAGTATEITKSRIELRESRSVSTMPPLGRVLEPRELRDLIEFLANLK